MRICRFSNGETYPIRWFGDAEGILYIELSEIKDLGIALNVFSDSVKTNEMVCQYSDEQKTTYSGYNELIDVKKDVYDGYITVALINRDKR